MQIDRLAVHLEGMVTARSLPAAPREIVMPPDDDPPDAQIEHLGDAEGQSFMIEYIDAGGHVSSRRISVYGIARGRAGVPLLTAKCHERNATRQFRVDRIRCCIDYSGEVHDDVATFLADNFGMARELAVRKAALDANARWRDIVDLVRDDAILLAAMSQSDGSIHAGEIDEATRYLAEIVERTGIMLTEWECNGLAAHIRRLRPNRAAIERALEQIARHDASRVQKLLRAAVAVLDADGRRHPAELELLDAICIELTGVGIAA